MNGFFSTVQYASGLESDSWLSKFENAADVCRSPSRWFAGELWGGGKKYEFKILMLQTVGGAELSPSARSMICLSAIKTKAAQGMQKVLRIIVGLLLSLPGQIAAIPLMAIAYVSQEIRLKHKAVVRPLSPEETQKLKELIAERQKLAKERQGCEAISCLLLSICCLLCCLVCKK